MATKKQASGTDEAYAEGFEDGAESGTAGEVGTDGLVPIEGGPLDGQRAEVRDDAADATRYRHARARGLIHSDRVFTHNEVAHQPQKLEPSAADAFLDWDMSTQS